MSYLSTPLHNFFTRGGIVLSMKDCCPSLSSSKCVFQYQLHPSLGIILSGFSLTLMFGMSQKFWSFIHFGYFEYFIHKAKRTPDYYNVFYWPPFFQYQKENLTRGIIRWRVSWISSPGWLQFIPFRSWNGGGEQSKKCVKCFMFSICWDDSGVTETYFRNEKVQNQNKLLLMPGYGEQCMFFPALSFTICPLCQDLGPRLQLQEVFGQSRSRWRRDQLWRLGWVD